MSVYDAMTLMVLFGSFVVTFLSLVVTVVLALKRK